VFRLAARHLGSSLLKELLVVGQVQPKMTVAENIIVSQNLFEIDPHKINETKVLTTIVRGRTVF
jgi:predicted amidohydrolase YtcJ